MTLVYADRVKETSTTTGTGTYTLAGAVTGFQSFAIIGNANTCYYAATDGTNWEVGLGTYTSAGTTLARTSILASSNANAAVSWAAGTKTLWVDFPALVATYLAGGTTGSGAVVLGTAPTIATPVLNGTPTGTGVATAATASTLALRDANGNLTTVNVLEGYTTTATAAGTTTLTVASNYLQFFTGVTTQTVVMPVTSTLVLGQEWLIVNQSTGAVTINSSGGNAIVVLAAGTAALVTTILLTGTSAASWAFTYYGDVVASGKKLTVSNTLTLAGTDGTTMTFPTTSATLARTDAANTFTGTQTYSGVITVNGTATSTVAGPFDISGASAGQIVFPASQNASAGANTLDDYEEGTWTPTITFGGAAVGITYTTQSGGYIKIGQQVTFWGRVILSSKGSSTGNALLNGLPFTNSTTFFGGFFAPFYQAMATISGGMFGTVNTNTTNITLYTGSAGQTAGSTLTNAFFTNTSDIIISGYYRATA